MKSFTIKAKSNANNIRPFSNANPKLSINEDQILKEVLLFSFFNELSSVKIDARHQKYGISRLTEVGKNLKKRLEIYSTLSKSDEYYSLQEKNLEDQNLTQEVSQMAKKEKSRKKKIVKINRLKENEKGYETLRSMIGLILIFAILYLVVFSID